MKTYINRLLEPFIKKTAETMPVIVMTGPRQSGKTTLAKHLFPDYLYVNLEFPDIRLFAEKDPRGFLKQSDTMIIDEIQRIPELFSYIQGIVDEDPSKKYILTGSNNFSLMHTVSQSLAGRVGIFSVFPFSISELRQAGMLSDSLNKTIFQGFYPRVIADGNDPVSWYQGYIQTYLERDVRDMSAIHMIERFYTFLRIIAMRVGSIMNYATIATEVGVAPNTIRGWITILEASYIITLLQPYHTNTKKRLIKSAKLYFNDTGLLCSLLGISNERDIPNNSLSGFIFENYVIAEYLKNEKIFAGSHNLYFYRDHEGNEVDMVSEHGIDLNIFEIKLNKVFSNDFVKGLKYFDSNIKIVKTRNIIYGGDISQKIGDVSLISWKDIL
jgi:predicted AAA+ superfamily ATPase